MQRSLAIYNLRAFKLGLCLARILPRPLSQWLAPHIGRACYARRPASREALRTNLGLVSGAAGVALDALCAQNVANFSRMLADYFLCAATAGECATSLLAAWRGLEHIQSARARGNGVQLVTGHLGSWELGGMLLAKQGLSMNVITPEEPATEATRWRD